jgi:hypothetical protein
LKNSVHYLLPYRKKDQFKAYGVKKHIPRMEMGHHQDVTVELSTHLLVAQRKIETPHPTMGRGHHHPRLHEDGRGSDQRPLHVRHRHLDSHLLHPEFGQGARSE